MQHMMNSMSAARIGNEHIGLMCTHPWVTPGEKIGGTTLFLWQQGAMLGEENYNNQ